MNLFFNYYKIKITPFLVCVFFNLNTIFLNAQQVKPCEKIIESPDTTANYKEGKKSLYQYVQANLIPILGDCIKEKMEFVNSLTIKFIINKTEK